jgi:hypothetical protein
MSTSITFQQFAEPPLETGSYLVTLTQTVNLQLPGTNSQAQVDQFVQTQAFEVAGIRFTMPGTMVVSEYPPSGNQGVFANILPHVVLSDPTLPWQLDTGYEVTRSPWLALFTVDEIDPAPPIQNLSIADLIPTDNTIFFPTLSPLPGALAGESSTDPVNVIDVPVALFYALAPCAADLQWLAHVRQTDVTNKATVNNQPPPSLVSVVVGNRLAAAEARTTVHLVSFEGYGLYLPNADGSPPTQAFPAGTESVRLVSLYNWVFQSNSEPQSFTDILENVSSGPMQRPYTAPQTPGASDIIVQDSLEMGYTGMTHTLLTGEQTGSWYRGPLLPYSATNFTTPPFQTPDQLLRYDPSTGMFDTTYAAAWQFGQLAALHDNTYLAALMRWKRRRNAQAVIDFENNLLDGQLGQSHDTAFERFNTIGEKIIKPAAQALVDKRKK